MHLLRKNIFILFVVFFISLGAISSVLHYSVERMRTARGFLGDLPAKMLAFRQHSADYDLVFLGDSRTYCAMHPERLDPLLGLRTINLAHWAHWFPTQEAQFQDLMPLLRPGTIVVWSIGHQNFTNVEIRESYPLSLANARKLFALGVPLANILPNLIRYTPPLALWEIRSQIMDRIRAVDRAALCPPQPGDPAAASPSSPALPAWLSLQDAPRREIQAPEGTPVALSLYLKKGGYLLCELEPAHFRSRQKRSQGAVFSTNQVLPACWALFREMLDLFRRHQIRLIVNVLEEAPHSYANRESLEASRRFMDTTVRREVESYGFSFVHVDMDQLTDADYFDYNHLNSKGVTKYSLLLAQALKPVLAAEIRMP